MLFQELPQIVESSLFVAAIELDRMEKHTQVSEDAEELRKPLSEHGLVAFIADESILPRASGIDPRPLDGKTAIPFRSPESLRYSIQLPHAGAIIGMGIPKGVTLIVGGGYHGKSTLLQAIELGIYNHIPGDGREFCVSLPTAIKVRAASGRSVVKTDISSFINNLPQKQDTTTFSTQNASGSTSQAAFITESIEAGAKLLLMDEDTCAVNLMIRDGRMQQLVARDQEPITAFVDRVRQLYQELGVSTVLVMGGSGDYFDVADCVIRMTEFGPEDVTTRARDIADALPTQRKFEGDADFPQPKARAPFADGLDPKNEYGHFRISATDAQHLVFGQNRIDLDDIEQLTETAQTCAIGRAFEYAKKFMDGRTSMHEIMERVMAEINLGGLDILDTRYIGDLASFRGIDLASALNRFRGLTVQQLK